MDSRWVAALQKYHSHRDRGGSWSRNAELSSLLKIRAGREEREKRGERTEQSGEVRGEERERGEKREERRARKR